jgi:hypothetical protein
MSEATPPPYPGETTSVRTGFRFSTATLLGLTTLVAVACALTVTVPGLLGLLLALLANACVVGLAAFLIGGAWLSAGDRRLFCVASLGCMVLMGTTDVTHKLAWQFHSGSMGGDATYLLSIVLIPAEVISFSLLGGWIAVRTKRFWLSKELPLSAQESPPAPGRIDP